MRIDCIMIVCYNHNQTGGEPMKKKIKVSTYRIPLELDLLITELAKQDFTSKNDVLIKIIKSYFKNKGR